MEVPTIVPIKEDEHICGWLEHLAEINNVPVSLFLKHYCGIEDALHTKGDWQLRNVSGLSRITETNILGNLELREILFKHTTAPVDSLFMDLYRSAMNMESMINPMREEHANRILNSFLAPRFRYCPVCMKEDMGTFGRKIIHVPHQHTGVNACWKHKVLLTEDHEATTEKAASPKEVITSEFTYSLYRSGITGSIRDVTNTLRSDEIMYRIGKLERSGKLQKIFEYAGLNDLKEFCHILMATNVQHVDNRRRIILTVSQLVSAEELIKNCPAEDIEKIREECEKILDSREEGGSVLSVSYPFVGIRCGKCGKEYRAYHQAVRLGVSCPHCGSFALKNEGMLYMFRTLAKRDGFALSGKSNGARYELIHSCGRKMMAKPRLVLSRGEIICDVCGGPIPSRANTRSILQAIERLGSRKEMSCGMACEIIVYNSAKDVTVRFDDGTIRENASYNSFQKGAILPSDRDNFYESKYLGMTSIMACGKSAKIIAYRGYQDIDVEFDDGSKLFGTSCSLFKERSLMPDIYARRTGMKVMQKCGLEAEITKYRSYHDIDIRFENGEELFGVDCARFDERTLFPDSLRVQKKTIKDPSLCALHRLRWIGEKKVMKCGKEAEIVEYRSRDDIDVVFDDGTKLSHVSRRKFVKGTLHPPGEDCRGDQNVAARRLGTRRRMNCGQMAEIISYKNAHDMDVVFENGIIKKSCDYFRFKKGELSPSKMDRTLRFRKGERAMMKCGLGAVIIEYRSSKDIDVEFSNGMVVTGAEYCRFANRTLRPCSNRSIERIGEKRVMNCGIEAEIIAYRNANDIDLMFSDGRVRKHVAYHNFKTGRVSPPDQSET